MNPVPKKIHSCFFGFSLKVRSENNINRPASAHSPTGEYRLFHSVRLARGLRKITFLQRSCVLYLNHLIGQKSLRQFFLFFTTRVKDILSVREEGGFTSPPSLLPAPVNFLPHSTFQILVSFCNSSLTFFPAAPHCSLLLIELHIGILGTGCLNILYMMRRLR